jgi:hypothetical protein
MNYAATLSQNSPAYSGAPINWPVSRRQLAEGESPIPPEVMMTEEEISEAVSNLEPQIAAWSASRQTIPAPEPVVVVELSKLSIRRRLRELGKEEAFGALLDSLPHARADWDDAQVLLTSDPLFTQFAQQFQAALGLTGEQFDSVIAP